MSRLRTSQSERLVISQHPWVSQSASPGPDHVFLNKIGLAATVLLIIGASLALASLAWFLIGLFVN